MYHRTSHDKLKVCFFQSSLTNKVFTAIHYNILRSLCYETHNRASARTCLDYDSTDVITSRWLANQGTVTRNASHHLLPFLPDFLPLPVRTGAGVTGDAVTGAGVKGEVGVGVGTRLASGIHSPAVERSTQVRAPSQDGSIVSLILMFSMMLSSETTSSEKFSRLNTAEARPSELVTIEELTRLIRVEKTVNNPGRSYA